MQIQHFFEKITNFYVIHVAAKLENLRKRMWREITRDTNMHLPVYIKFRQDRIMFEEVENISDFTSRRPNAVDSQFSNGHIVD